VADEEKEVELRFTASDEASSPISKIAGLVDHLGHKVEHIAEGLMRWGEMLTGFVGIYSLTESVRGANEYLSSIDRVRQLTKMSATEVVGLTHAMELSDMEAGDIASTLGRISKATTKINHGNKQATADARRWGLDLKHGPEKAILSISDAVDKGKMKAGDVARVIGGAGEGLGNMMAMLNKGQATLQGEISEGQEENKSVTDSALDAFGEYDTKVKEIRGSWQALVTSVVVKFQPYITAVMDWMKKKIDDLRPAIEAFGNFFVKHIDAVTTAAKLLGKVLLANTLIGKATGGKLGIYSGAKRLITGGAGFLERFAPKVGGMWTAANGTTGLSFASGGLKMLTSSATRLGIAGLALGVIVKAVSMLINNTDGIRDRLSAVFSTIWDSVKRIYSALKPVIAALMYIVNTALTALAKALLWAVEKLATLISMLTQMIAAFLETISGAGKSLGRRAADNAGLLEDVSNAGGSVEKLRELQRLRKEQEAQYASDAALIKKRQDLDKAAANKAADRKKATDNANPAGNYQDFRNSRFDITQSFAEGFDPDRVAVAVASDIADLGEKKLQSGLTPLFTIR